MKTFLQKLVKENIYLSLKEGELSVKVPKTGVDPEIIGEIKAKKTELIEYLSKLADPDQIPTLSQQENYSLSYVQKRIWDLSRLDKGSIAYNVPGTIEFGAALDKDRFMQALNAGIDRHESLRTVFRLNESGKVRQYILSREDLNFEIDYFDFSNVEDKEEKAGEFINKDAYLPFDLENGPLFRAALFKIEEEKYIFYYNMHSIAADGESIEIFTREAMVFSEALKDGSSPSLPELKIQYKDFANWQSKCLENNRLKEHKNYWSTHLSGNLPILDLPNQKERPATKTFSGKLLGTNFSIETSNKIKSFVNDKGGNLFMGLMTLWKVFLYFQTSQKDLVIGTQALGRDHPDLEGQIGPYINMIAIRSRINPNESFIQFYEKVKEVVSKSYSFQMYPYEKIIQDIDFSLDPSRNPIFDTAMVLQREEQVLEDFQIAGIKKGSILELGIGKKYVDTVVAKYDVEIDFRELGGCLWYNINYNTDLYDRETIIDLMVSFRTLSNFLVDHLSKPISSISTVDLFTSEEV
ncbi:condensation domain-containing protein [Aquimarina gracilis]|uniref:Condensation domain-containing protein n=1 Tax=Aquimarina gracilis TaxID=874422 RepID=A0ABU5ZUA3_9FLAO|nr:condensation domain-containing protein [Aquimarina gracilis]MEB3344962.1 condensation domain-containing protein [Aquimarina gracilis]